MRPLMRPVTVLPLLLAVCAGCQQTQPVGEKKPAIQAAKDQDRPSTSDAIFTGTQSCSNRGCHASLDQSNAEKDPLPCSYTLFYSQGDPHAQAWDVLSSKPKARQMAKLLHPEADADKDGLMKDGVTAVAKDRRCLACHATPQSAYDTKAFDEKGVAKQVDAEWQFGVGCESCHGRGTKWRELHYQEDWKKKSAEDKEKLGFNDLSDLRKRALVCAGCHVGAPADDTKKLPLRDMNHDHVAAGHPRLMFEFLSFLCNEPPHWKEKEKNAGKEVFARAWFEGQSAAAEASLRLTADRAKMAGKDDLGRPWPELTEYDCYACHQNLRVDSWRAGMESTRHGSPGRFRPSRWYTGLLVPLGLANKADLDLLESDLRKPHPPAEAVAQKATALADALGKRSDKVDAGQIRRALIARGQMPDQGAWQLSWDECEQIALGLLAVARAQDDKAGQEKATELLKRLRFSPGADAPTGFRAIERKGEQTTRPFDEWWRSTFPKP